MMPGFPDFTTEYALAGLLGLGSATGTPGGVPLLHGIDVITSLHVENISAGSTNFPFFTFTKPGYIVFMQAVMASGAATIPFLECAFYWQDNSGTNYQKVEWSLPATSSGGNYLVSGCGPVRGSGLNIHLKNLDPAVAMTVTLSIMETTHHISRDDWRNTNNDFDVVGTIPGYTVAPGAVMTANLLTAGSTALAVSQSKSFLLPVYAGQVFVNFVAQSGTTVDLILAIPTGISGAGAQLFNDTAGGFTGTFVFPRVPVLMTVTNPSSSVTTTANVTIAAMEYAS